MKKTKFKCDNCGAIKEIYNSHFKGRAKHYCSKECRLEALSGGEIVPEGEKNGRWNGGRVKDAIGYIRVDKSLVPDELMPFLKIYNNRAVYEHQLVMVEKLGRPLRPGCQIHHINGDKSDNRIENLVELSVSDHRKMHSKKK